ncbi:response regulator transcription factor [Sciscionella marina]|uniref:response regulator transcription factor n=1 Tax=Sciscionella marina TaxID=508770 RepID=UPI00037B2532|nr:response regulator transcription factor [Sciscionella marina]
MRVLLVEDDDRVADALMPVLTKRGFELGRLDSGKWAASLAAQFDVVLLDLGLPDVDGFELCRRIRARSSVVIIVVSARAEVGDRINALQSGADDYLVKPYDVGELVARIEAVSRRAEPRAATTVPAALVRFAGGAVEVDVERHEVRVHGRPITLSRKEFQILALIVRAQGAVCSRERILAQVWGRSWPGAHRTLDVHIATLRTKLDLPTFIQTVRGVGYRLSAEYLE